ncbi:MAG: PKD domain-containing protein, partial [Bacteroidota bacterium]
GAPVGDESVYLQSGGTFLSLPHPDGDEMGIGNITGNPTSLHLYLVAGEANTLTPPATIAELDSTRYWGVYMNGGTNPAFDLEYFYVGNPLVLTACDVELAKRTDNASTTWTDENATNFPATGRLQLLGAGAGEYILGVQNLNVNITATGPLNVCQGDSVSLDGTTAGATNYQWRLNGNDIMGATGPSYVAQNSGSYSLMVSAANCLSMSSPVTVQINPLPMVSLDSVPPLCLNATPLSLSGGMPLGGNYSGLGVSGGQFDPMSSGVGTSLLTYVYTDANGCSDSASRNVSVLSLPTVSLDSFPGLCQEASPLSLSGGMPMGGTYMGLGVSNNQFDPSAVGPGMTNIEYTITGANGCANTATRMIEVFAAPSVNAGPDQSICRGDTATLNSSLANAYLWSTNETTQSILVSPTMTTTYTVQITDQNGCQNQDSLVLTVQDAPVPDAGPDQTICEGESADLTATGGQSYIWDNNQNGATITVQPTQLTTYIVTAFDNLGCSGKDTVVVDVNPLPDPAGTFSISGGVVQFQNGSQNATSYSWDFGDGSPASTDVTPSHLYVFNGTYTVNLTATNDCGSVDTTFSVDVISASLEEEHLHFAVYPNPFREQIQIELGDTKGEAHLLQITDLRGSVLRSSLLSPTPNATLSLDLKDLAPRVYFLRIGNTTRSLLKY